MSVLSQTGYQTTQKTYQPQSAHSYASSIAHTTPNTYNHSTLSQSVPTYSTYHYPTKFPTRELEELSTHHSLLGYYPPEPRDTFQVNPLALGSMKQLDLCTLTDCFGRSIQMRKNKSITSNNYLTQVFSEDLGIQDIKATIAQAKLNKERAHQIREIQTRKLQKIVRDAEEDEKVLENLGNEEQEEHEKQRRRKEEMLKTKRVIQQQMADHEKAKEESLKEYERDKQQIDAIVQRILTEDKAAIEENIRKKALAKTYMDNAYAEKAEMKRKQKEEEELRKAQERKYHEEVAKREQEQAQKQKAIQDEKDKIFEKLCAEKARQQAEKDYWEDVRNQLHDEENARLNKIKELEEQEKQQKQKEEMLQWAILQMQKKEEKKKEEEKIENEIKQKMLAKFAEDDRQEQLNLERRKQKIKEFQDDIETQWRIKREQFLIQRRQYCQSLKHQRLMELEKMKLIQQEKERLIRENEDLLKNYYAKGYYKTLKHLEQPLNQ